MRAIIRKPVDKVATAVYKAKPARVFQFDVTDWLAAANIFAASASVPGCDSPGGGAEERVGTSPSLEAGVGVACRRWQGER
jgi:hypothetical protein